MRRDAGSILSSWEALLLAAGAVALAVPLAVGWPNPRLGAQSQTGQSSPGAPKFEVASIKPNKSGDGNMRIGMQRGGRFTAINVPLRDLIRVQIQESLRKHEAKPHVSIS